MITCLHTSAQNYSQQASEMEIASLLLAGCLFVGALVNSSPLEGCVLTVY